MSLGDDAVLAARINGAIQLHDNIYLDPILETADTSVIMSPGVEFRMGSDISNSKLNIVYVHDFVTYRDNTELNRDNPNFSLDGSYGTAKSGITYRAAYKVDVENSASNNALGELVTRAGSSAGIEGEWGMTAKTSMRTGLNYSGIDFSQEDFVDHESISVPVDVFWKYSPKLDLSVGYRYRIVDYSGARPDQNDHFFNVGLRGQIAAKTSAQIKAGIQKRNFNTPGTQDADMFSVDGIVTWEASSKTTVTALFSRDFGADAYGNSIENTEIRLTGRMNFNEQFSGHASVLFTKDNYESGRSDDGLHAQLGVNYQASDKLIFTLAQIYYKNDSSLLIANFDSNITRLSGTLRF